MMSSFAYFAAISIAVFSGAVVSGVAGFAFSAVAGAILLHVMPPIEAVPLMMSCSVLAQISSFLALMRGLQWKRSLIFTTGGLLGIGPAIYLLQHIETGTFRMGFGLFVSAYAAYMLLRPAVAPRVRATCVISDGLIGFGGGLIGGLTAMPGALPAIWCDLHGLPKVEQRGAVQPFIVLMQLIALVLLMPHVGWSSRVVWLDLAISLPALAAGTMVGVTLFGRVQDTLFRRIVLGSLLVSGLALVV
jgi:uncharacterized membrane protein YfcA